MTHDLRGPDIVRMPAFLDSESGPFVELKDRGAPPTVPGLPAAETVARFEGLILQVVRGVAEGPTRSCSTSTT
ncbi:hypothetical protein L6V77_16745 [Myxococcota bacterium]|nr:hypothetical protein [Myxococcota bacterium]